MEVLPLPQSPPGQWLIVCLGRKPGNYDGPFFIAPRGHMKVIQPQCWLPIGLDQSIPERADSPRFRVHPELTYLPKPWEAAIAHGSVTAPQASADWSQRKAVLAYRPGFLCFTCRNKLVRGFEKTVSPLRQMQASSCKLIKTQSTWGRAKRPAELHNLRIQVAPNYIWGEANELFVYFSFKIQGIVEILIG